MSIKVKIGLPCITQATVDGLSSLTIQARFVKYSIVEVKSNSSKSYCHFKLFGNSFSCFFIF